MGKGINKVILVGNLGSAPEARSTSSGAIVTNIALATNETWKDRETSEQRQRTEWHRLVLFGRLAEVARDYLSKGSSVYVEGRLQTRKWQDKNGSDRYSTEVVVSELQMLYSRPAEMPKSEPKSNADNSPVGDTDYDFFDDDSIPF